MREVVDHSDETLPDNASISDLESELQTDHSVLGSPFDNSTGMENSSPTNSGPDSEAASVDDLPADAKKNLDPGYIPEDLTNKMAAATSYVGSFFNPSSWKNPPDKSPESPEGESSSRKNSTAGAGGGPGLISSSLFSAIGKVQGFTKVSPSEETKEGETGETEKNEEQNNTSSGGFFSAFSKIGIAGISSSETIENISDAAGTGKTPTEDSEESDEKKKETWGNSFSNAFNKVGKVATDYSKVVQETVYKAPLIADFNKEQEEFIRTKGDKELPSAPWAGYQNEEELKEKIFALSDDKRNVLRAPPSGVNFDFEYSNVATPALLLLEADPKLKQLRYELVPKVIKEDEFWKNYFYRVSLIKQSFELSNSMTEGTARKDKQATSNKPIDDDNIENAAASNDHDDEFVSELHQASSKDIAEADEAMKKLGLTKNDTEWEAELEGELNEYEMVGDDGEAVEVEDNPEWENQIQEMLEAESKKT